MICWSSKRSRMRRSEARVKRNRYSALSAGSKGSTPTWRKLRQLAQSLPFRHQRQAKAARIVIAQLGAVVEIDDDVIVLSPRRARRDADQFARHAEMKKPDGVAGQVEHNIFGDPRDRVDPLPRQRFKRPSRRPARAGAAPAPAPGGWFGPRRCGRKLRQTVSTSGSSGIKSVVQCSVCRCQSEKTLGRAPRGRA